MSSFYTRRGVFRSQTQDTGKTPGRAGGSEQYRTAAAHIRVQTISRQAHVVRGAEQTAILWYGEPNKRNSYTPAPLDNRSNSITHEWNTAQTSLCVLWMTSHPSSIASLPASSAADGGAVPPLLPAGPYQPMSRTYSAASSTPKCRGWFSELNVLECAAQSSRRCIAASCDCLMQRLGPHGQLPF